MSIDAMRLCAIESAALHAKQTVGDGTWIDNNGEVWTSRSVVRTTKKGDLARNGYNGYRVLITMGTSATRRDRATAAHIAMCCPDTVLALVEELRKAWRTRTASTDGGVGG